MRVVLADVGMDAKVIPVGVEADGQMELPEDPDLVGWYRYGPGPGTESGSVVLAGHVDSRKYGIGQLARLREAEPGDEVVLRTVGGRQARYRVITVQSLRKGELPVAQLFRRQGDPMLVLVTCGGSFDRARGRYEDNVVVTAVPA